MDRLVTIPEESMVIPQETYDDMRRDSFLLYLLANALFDEAMLSYDGKHLTYDSEAVSAVLRSSVFHRRYEMTLEDLKEGRDERSD